METSLPRLLLITEATLDEKATGLNRTLFNLLSDYPMDRFMLYAPEEQLEYNPPAPPFGQHITSFSQGFSLGWRNRIEAWLSPLIRRWNLQMIDLLPVPNAKTINDFSPEVILICPDSPIGLVMGYKVAQSLNLPFLIYMMDDWVAKNHQRWFTGNTQAYFQRLLQDADGWIVISSQLEQILIERYAVKPERSLVAHNPVDVSSQEPPDFEPNQLTTFRIAYAGSIWVMHHDVVVLIAEAVFELRQEGHDIELVLYTQDGFWATHQDFWEACEVIHGGMISYAELHRHLKQADLLLVAASFLPEYAHMTTSSVQTKITDYMAVGKPIFSCGPIGGACNEFVRRWNCGLVCETNELTEVKTYLLEQIQNRVGNQSLAKKAYQVLLDDFEMSKVNRSFYKFIQQSNE